MSRSRPYPSLPLDLRPGSKVYRGHMTTYSIGETAERSGFSASALRYYEDIGLVPPPSRSDAGYRVYDDRSLARLAFISRAKQLGCSLEEITDLLAIWEQDRCGPVQQSLHRLVSQKFRGAERQIAELSAFVTQLRPVARKLSREPLDGPCTEDCVCLAGRATNALTAVGVSSDPIGGEATIACTLDPEMVPARVTDWQAMLGLVDSRTTLPDGALRLAFSDSIHMIELAGLVGAEQQCCSFFSFAITVDTRGVALEVRAPAAATEMVASLFGQPA